jgi:hypothetical protein
MRKAILFSIVFLASLCLAAVLASAQRGRPSSPPGGSGGGHMGGPGASGSGSTAHGDHSTNASTTSTSSGKTASEILSKNTKLSSKISSLTGMDAQKACSGFKNLGQCIAAAHVSKNLGISFADLKTKMMGGDSLGKSIQVLQPAANSKTAAKKAQKQANDDLNETAS